MKRCGITPIDVWPRFNLLWGSGKSIGCSWLKLESGNGHFGGCWVAPNGSTDCRAVSHYWVQPISENECSKSDGWMNKSEEKKVVTGSATCPDAGRHLLRYQCEFDTVSRSPKSKTNLFHSAYGLKGLRSDTAADRCVNLAAHMSERHGRIHTSFFWRFLSETMNKSKLT